MHAAAAPSRYKAGQSVALFLPCYCDALYPQVGQACVTIFERLGIPLDYPPDQTCCGQPAFNSGLWPEASALAKRFARVFAPYDWVVVPSGSCGAMARIFYGYMDRDSAAARLGARVFDLSTFLVDVAGTSDVGARFPHRVTYLDGCHGRRELGATSAAIRLLKAVRDLEYVELPHIEECCGFGGTFSVNFAELSTSMGVDKCRNVQESGAEVLTSGDASCLMHVAGVLGKSSDTDARGNVVPRAPRIRILHLAEILGAA
ncbi:MAG: (Fe-S)-binding protein [Candidatus Eremiobacteraeota bacterium]|nr:(Fe-S)-binding protein [Candidatus Eremiobacteraeota bacterium]